MTAARMRPSLLLLLVSAALATSLPGPVGAMNGFGDDDVLTRIPEPSLDFRVRITDTDMNAFEVRKVSFDGQIYLSGTLGKARVSMPFDSIRKVIFEPMEGADVLALVTLEDGKQQALHVRGKTPCFGLAEFGNVSIDVADLRDVTFLGRAP